MATLYQRFNGKINTGNSFPKPPETSRLLGQGGEVEQAAESVRPRLQHPHSRNSEDEDVRTFPPALLVITNQHAPSFFKKMNKRILNIGPNKCKRRSYQTFCVIITIGLSVNEASCKKQ